ncbi:hypothetical protein ACOME3_007303 [Neoechinorhynchus agilis]
MRYIHYQEMMELAKRNVQGTHEKVLALEDEYKKLSERLQKLDEVCNLDMKEIEQFVEKRLSLFRTTTEDQTPLDTGIRPETPIKAKRRTDRNLADDMADFIVDDDGNEANAAEVENTLLNVFGYDARKFKQSADFDEDDDMEASFEEIMKEERKSKLQGIREDMEDMRLEEMRKRAKMVEREK